MIRCGKVCWGSSSCKNKRECACRCGDLSGINASLEESCIGACQADSSWQNVPSGVKWMLRNFSPEELFHNYQVRLDDYDPTSTWEYEEFEDKQGKENEANSFQQKIILTGAVFILLLVMVLIFVIPTKKGRGSKPKKSKN